MSDRMHVATRKGLFTLDRRNGAWSVTRADFLGDNCTMVLHDERDGSLYAGLGHGHFGMKLHRSEDEGRTWEELAPPAYPPKPDDYEEPVNDRIGKPTPWTLEMIWELRPGGHDQDGLLWCGTLPGGLFRSDDRADSWELIEPLWTMPERHKWFGGGYDLPGIHSVCVDPRNSNHVTVGVSCGGAWHTEDLGRTWEVRATGMRAEYMPPDLAGDPNIQDPHLLVQCRDQPDAMWVQHHNGIFRSTDRGRAWTELQNVKPACFGFAVSVHPSDPQTAWFVPGIKDEKRIPVDGKLVVNRTRDGGKTFEQLTNGLPQTHAYDLVFRHAMDIDQSGDRLAFGSTTGSLWVTDNGGDAWTTISHHLPPVHVVRFVK